MDSFYQQELKRNSSLNAWKVVLCVSLFFFFEFGLGNVFNTLSPAILLKTPHTNIFNLSIISSLYFYTNILGLIPAGYILDRVSPKVAIVLALLLCSCSITMFAYFNTLTVLVFSRLIMGAAASFCLIGCVRIATNWFPSERLGLVIGLIISIGMFGGYVVQSPLGRLLDSFGLEYTLYFIALVGFSITFLIFLFVQDQPDSLKQYRLKQAKILSNEPILKLLFIIFKKRQNWYCALYVGLINIGTWMLGGMWSNKYLMVVHKVDLQEARLITGNLFLGMIFAYPFWGFISEVIQRRKPMLIVGSFGSVLILLIVIFIKIGVFHLSILFFLLGFITSVQTLTYPVIGEINPIRHNALSTSLLSINSLFWGGVIAIPLFGVITNFFSSANFNHQNIKHIGFNLGMGILLTGFVFSIIFAFLIKETYCRRQVD